MEDIQAYPERYRKNIKRLSGKLGTDFETSFSMMLMTAILTDLYPEDPKVADYILKDCGIEIQSQEEEYA